MFRQAPRYIGVPHQFYCETQVAFNNFEKMFRNRVPFFVSTYKFVEEKVPVFDNLFFDIDSYFSIRIPYKNTKELIEFIIDHKVPVVIDFSGGKGFHIFAIFKEQEIRTPEAIVHMKNLMYSAQKHITNEIGLEAYDDPTLGRIRFLVRYPTSKYIRANDEGNLEWNGLYCRNISVDDFNKGIKHVSKLVREPGVVPRKPHATMTLKQFTNKLDGFKLIERHKLNKNKNEMNNLSERTGITVPTIAGLGVPCLKEIASHKHPSHFERIEVVAWLKYLGYTDTCINAFIKQLNWLDYNYRTTSYQVSQIKARYPMCKFLRKAYGKHCKHCTLFRRRGI